MSTINVEYFSERNRKLVRLINDFGEILSREDFKAYKEIVLTIDTVDNDKKLTEQEEKEILVKIYNGMINKFKEFAKV
jgi:hypothetical protein